MKARGQGALSRRGLAALFVAAPAAASLPNQKPAPAGASGAAAEAQAAQSANRARLNAVKLAREVEPAFRFEP
jgi:hypothetical protein